MLRRIQTTHKARIILRRIIKHASLKKIEQSLDHLFQIEKYGKDSAFSRFIPAVYDPIKFPWQQFFEANFVDLFNGLMMHGSENVNKVFLAVFPTDDVLETFISQSTPGDLLFMHHPLVMECGDPLGRSGRGFIPIPEKYLQGIKENNFLYIHVTYQWIFIKHMERVFQLQKH